jgi:hypothetical protein
MRPSAHRLTPKRACDQRSGGQCLLELDAGGAIFAPVSRQPPGHSTKWRPSVARLAPTSSSFCTQISTRCLARNPPMTRAAWTCRQCARSTICYPEKMGPPIQFVAGRRAYRDSVRRRANYSVGYGWRLLHDAPLAAIAQLHALVLRTAVHAVWLHLSRRG